MTPRRTDLHPHLLRATALTYMLETMDLPTVQDIAGHDDPRTTRGYAQTRPAVLRAKMEQFRFGLEPVQAPEQEAIR